MKTIVAVAFSVCMATSAYAFGGHGAPGVGFQEHGGWHGGWQGNPGWHQGWRGNEGWRGGWRGPGWNPGWDNCWKWVPVVGWIRTC